MKTTTWQSFLRIVDREENPLARVFQRSRNPRAIAVQPQAPPASISVIIPAHNEGRYLGATLESLSRQNHPAFEVIVVANGCNDNTVEVAQGKADRVINLQQKGLSRARNIGAWKARGDLLVFLDADTLLPPDCLEVISREFTEEHAAGTLRGVPDSKSAIHKAMYAVKNGVHKFHLHPGSSGVILCWREAFKAVNGFDEHLHVRENSDLSKKLLWTGKYKYIQRTHALTSMRRYEKNGLYRTLYLWFKLWFISLFSDLRNRNYDSIR